MTKLSFSVYPCHTSSPSDPSVLCTMEWPSNKIAITKFNKKLSGMCKKGPNTIACIGDGISTLDGDQSVTHNLMNQLHSVFCDGDLTYVCSTGLDLLLVFKNNKLIKTWHPDHGTDLSWLEKMDYRNKNYRTLKINKHHVNHVFVHDGNIYVCCGKAQRYYVLDSDLNVISSTKVVSTEDIMHDGVVVDDKVWFTRTDGSIMSFKIGDNKITDVINIKEKWIRGLVVLENGNFVVGASSVDKPPQMIEFTKDGSIVNKQVLDIKGVALPQIYSILA